MQKAIVLFLGLVLCLDAVAATKPEYVEFQTNLGTIAIKLDYAKAPITANNFINYAQSGFYNQTLIHRVIKNFVVQGGGFSLSTGQQKATNPPIALESKNGLSNVIGTVAMARTSAPNSATSQFFINVANNTNLNYVNDANPGYAVFGKVIKGMDVVTNIQNLPTFVFPCAAPCSPSPAFPFTTTSNVVVIDRAISSLNYDTTKSITRILTNRNQGTVTSVPAGINCGTVCNLVQNVGAALRLQATPKPGFVFAGWRGDCQGMSPTINIGTAKGNHNCTAMFLPVSTALQ